MDISDVRICTTSRKLQTSLLKRSYTVYHIKIHTAATSYMINKRFRQFYTLRTQLKNEVNFETLPIFPSKCLLSMSNKVISHRKSALETWLSELIKQNPNNHLINKFLKVHKNIETFDLQPDESLIEDFIKNITETSNQKFIYLSQFEKDYFARRRFINDIACERLLQTLAPLCSDAACMSKPIDIMSKLINRNFNIYNESMQKAFQALSVKILKEMGLNHYLTKQVNPDSQLKAYEILDMLMKGNFTQTSIEEILHNDKEAIHIFNSWGIPDIKPCIKKSAPGTISLLSLKDLSLDYTLNEKIIMLSGHFQARSKISTIVDLILEPKERKKWDLRLKDMQNTSKGVKMVYLVDNRLFELESSVSVIEKKYYAELEFNGKLLSCDNGEICTKFTIENIQGNEIDQFSEYQKLRCSWSYQFKGKASKIIIYDLVGEDNLLQDSFLTLKKVAEDEEIYISGRQKSNSIHEAVQRKSGISKLHII